MRLGIDIAPWDRYLVRVTVLQSSLQADLERDSLQADLERGYYQFGYEWDPPPSTEAVIGDVSDESASTLQASTSCRPGGSYDVDLPPQSL